MYLYGEVTLRAIVREMFETVLLAIIIFVVLQFSVQNYQVRGSSMQPTLDQGAYVLVNKLVYLFSFDLPDHGDVIVFRYPGDESRDFVKRVIGIPGDTLEIKRGQVILNGRLLKEHYVSNLGNSSESLLTVPKGGYYVLGDNRSVSNDSRNWGPVYRENIIGKAWFSFWPLHELSLMRVGKLYFD